MIQYKENTWSSRLMNCKCEWHKYLSNNRAANLKSILKIRTFFCNIDNEVALQFIQVPNWINYKIYIIS